MGKNVETPAEVYRAELRVLKAREDVLQMRLDAVIEQSVKIQYKLEECENGG